jgi:hypothetical protein
MKSAGQTMLINLRHPQGGQSDEFAVRESAIF